MTATDFNDHSILRFMAECAKYEERRVESESNFRVACERWHNACKLVDADHRAQKPCGKDYGLDDATAEKIAADVKREWERTT